MKEPVCKRVEFQPGDGAHRVATDVAHHVMPLKDLVQHNAVDEAPKTQAVQQTGHLRRRLTNHPRCARSAIGHGPPYPAMYWLRHDQLKPAPRWQRLPGLRISHRLLEEEAPAIAVTLRARRL